MPDAHKYGLLERGLHRLALGGNLIARASFDAEQSYLARQQGSTPGVNQPVFVAGLARAGTTLLMRLLYETGLFGSLTYRDMPFLLAPNLWRKVSHLFAKASVAEERAHGDGLMVDFDSPEALEEVFWRVMCSDSYIEQHYLKPMTADAEVVSDFRKYIAAVMRRYPGKRYLSKNNNNILRLGSLRRAFPDATILVPFRAPMAQAKSLRQQDQHFCSMHAQDEFAQSYMSWLAHYEFGAGHRPFVWGANATQARDSEGYWLAQWMGAYEYLLSLKQTQDMNLVFVGYEDLCRDPLRIWGLLSQRLGFEVALPSALPIKPIREQAFLATDLSLEAQALELYQRLQVASQHSLGVDVNIA
jgi:Sulfotransferase family